MELTDKEKEVLINILGKINRYETMAILCKSYHTDNDINEAADVAVNIFMKLTKPF